MGGETTQRYRARAARRPLLFWWHAFALLGLLVLLWAQLPLTAVLYETRVFPPLSEPRASYVALDPAYAAQVFKSARASWSVDRSGKRSSFEMDLGLVDLNSAMPPPAFLEQGARYPGVWRPSSVEVLRQRIPEVSVPLTAGASVAPLWPEQKQGVRATLDPSLKSAAFVFVKPEKALAERSGTCRFYVETDEDGSVAHVLLLSPRSGAAATLEQALLRGHAKSAARGFIDLAWSFVK